MGKKNEMMAPVVQAPMPQTFLSFCSDSKQDAGQTGADRKKKWQESTSSVAEVGEEEQNGGPEAAIVLRR